MDETVRLTITATGEDGHEFVKTSASVNFPDINIDEQRIATVVALRGLSDLVLIGLGL
jgi:hypothetical protein